MNTNRKNSFFISALLIIALTFVGCSKSNSNSDNPPPPASTAKITIGSMTKGSVILNGVHFDDSLAAITVDDSATTSAFLKDGMRVKVKGTVNADGINGSAEKIDVVSEVRGAIATANGADTLTVHGQTVLFDGGTVPAGVANIASLLAGDNVEVHGGRDDTTGVIHATRVEKLVGGVVADEVRGVVSGKALTTFNIGGAGGLTITISPSTVMVPQGATFVDGDIVQVHLSGSTATQIVVEHFDHPEFEAAQGQELSFEGILSGYSQTAIFKVGTQQVALAANAKIEGGVLLDLVDGMKVEAEGHTAAGGVLTAEKITIEDNVRLEGNASASGSASLLGKTVAMTSGTRFSGGLTSGASIAAGDGMQVRGFINRDGQTITATRVTKQSNPVAANKMIIQGPVISKDATAHTLVILGTTIDASGASGIDKNTGQPAGTIDQIFTSTTAGETIIKARGTVSGSTMTATEIEIE